MAKDEIISHDTLIKDGVPQFVIDHAPLLHLSADDRYFPTPLNTFVANTHPRLNHNLLPTPLPPLLPPALDTLDDYNTIPNSNNGKDIYLTSNEDITANPTWIEGIKPDAEGRIEEKIGVIVMVEKENGVVDVFYFYFWAFNFGGKVLGRELGHHVGDWEHNMIRFQDGKPVAVWYSQHANGQAFTFSALHKDSSGKRPHVYISTGTHALYPTPGPHDHTIPNISLPFPLLLTDYTTATGPLYDPLLSSYFYTYNTTTSTFHPFTFPSSSPPAPTGFLNFTGRWGDAEYPTSDPRQSTFLFGRFKKYNGGPTGPKDKQLGRKEVWPQNADSKGQRLRGTLGVGFGKWVKGLFKGKGKK